MHNLNINLYSFETIESSFIKVPKKNRKYQDEYQKDSKKKGKKDYSKQRDTKRNYD